MKFAFAAFTASFCLVVLTASAQNGPKQSASPQPTRPTDFPGLGEIMTLQQLRHIKLWFAGRAGNWALAEYEIGELNEGFEDADQLVGGGTVEKMVGAPIREIQKAVDEKNSAAFTAAFDRLTAGCDSCHRALGRPFIAIQRPTLLPYSDQSFTPMK